MNIKPIWHPWWLWECYTAGFFDESPKEMTKDRGLLVYRDFLGDLDRFAKGMKRILSEWKFSCEHNLSKSSVNRIAWLGQSAACIETGVPASCRGGFRLISSSSQRAANLLALEYLNQFLRDRGFDERTVNQEIH